MAKSKRYKLYVSKEGEEPRTLRYGTLQICESARKRYWDRGTYDVGRCRLVRRR